MKPNILTHLFGLTFLSASAQAAFITGVTIEDFSSELIDGTFDRTPAYTIDGSGFETNGSGTHTTAVEGNMWLTNGTFRAPNDPLPAHITFDLGANFDLASTTVWNYNEVTGPGANLTNRGANAVTISVASSAGGTFTSLGNFNFTQAPGNDTNDFGQLIDFSSLGADNVRLIRFDITSNHGNTDDFAGLSEVRFTAVPEPSIAILSALGLLTLLRRRR